MSTFSFVFSFTGRDEYLAARREWKTQYRALSQAQRDAKTSLKNAFRRNDVGAAFQCCPILFKSLFNVLETNEVNGFHDAKVVPMVVTMGVVVTNYPSVVSCMEVVIDVGKVVARNLAVMINPDFPPQVPVSTFVRNLVRFIVELRLRHDLCYHACCVSALSALSRNCRYTSSTSRWASPLNTFSCRRAWSAMALWLSKASTTALLSLVS